MNKIRQYINEHPKLKRLVKILGIVVILFSFLFNALIIGSLIINAVKQDDSTSKVLAYGDYQPKQAINGGSTSDPFYAFTTTYDGTNIIEFVLAYGDIENMSVGQSKYVYNPDLNSSTNVAIPFCTYGNFDYNIWADSNFTHNWSLTSVRLISTYTINGRNGSSYPAYTYAIGLVEVFAGSTPNETWCEYLIDYFPSANQGFTGYSINYSASSIPGGFLLVNTHNNNMWAYEQITYKSKDSYNVGYIRGYNNGYEAGQYDATLNPSTTNPFTLIRNAFSAIADILNIQVLPNLSLGVLLFTPIVITLIIIIVKMFRG